MSRFFRPGAGLLFCCGLLLAPAAPGQEKGLFWRAMDVEARLDADGRLHVTERQAIVFTGDWNGGERIFRIEPGQSLKLESVTRVDAATGEKKRLSGGDPAHAGHYRWGDPRTPRGGGRPPPPPPLSPPDAR